MAISADKKAKIVAEVDGIMKERKRWESRLDTLRLQAEQFGPRELGLPAGLRLAIEIMSSDGWRP